MGYGVLNETDADAIAIIQSIAAGAMIVVVVNEMIPITVRGAKRHAGLATAGSPWPRSSRPSARDAAPAPVSPGIW